MNAQVVLLVIVGLAAASLAAPAAPATPAKPAAAAPPAAAGGANGTSGAKPAAATSPVPATKPEYPKDLGNGVEMINREDCPGGYCETFLVRPPPPGMQQPMGMMGGMQQPMGMMGGMQPPMGMMGGMQPPMGGGNPCCPQLPPSPCGGQQQPTCSLGPPPIGCNSPCPPPPMMG